MSVNYKVPVSKELFENTVEKWISRALNKYSFERCGFCQANDIACKTSLNNKTITCRNCALYPKYCCADDSSYAKWDIAFNSHDEYTATQAALELLEGLYDYGVAHGYIADENITASSYFDGVEYIECGQDTCHNGECQCGKPTVWSAPDTVDTEE